MDTRHRRQSAHRVPRPLVAALGVILVLIRAGHAVAEAAPPTQTTYAPDCWGPTVDRVSDRHEAANAGFHVVLDEHLLVNSRRDMDCNGGGEVSVSGARAADNWLSVDRILGAMDEFDEVDAPSGAIVCGPTHAFAAGVLIFTPGDLRSSSPIAGDRPYASLLFLGNGRRHR
jgi:hypothetical protein